MGELSTIPSRRAQGSGEIVGWTFDFTDELGPGESIQSTNATLVELPSETPYPAGFQGPAQITGPGTINQVVQALVPRKRYRLVAEATIAADKVLWQALELDCPF